MEVEKFDRLIGRFVNVAALLTLVVKASNLYRDYSQKKISGAVFIGYVGVIIGISILVCFVFSLYLSKRRKDLLDSASKRASQFDYKYCSDIHAPGIFRFLCEKSGYDIDLQNLKDPFIIRSSDQRYCSAIKFYANEHIMESFACIPLKNENKTDKCILQVLYIPIDVNGNVPVILRMPDQHSSAGEDKPQFTFVSFSPVPQRYGATFNIMDCYHREVPSTPSRLEEYGMALSKQGSSYYLFYIFFARYDDFCFIKNGKLDYAVMKRVFSGEYGKMFAKDHDEILHATTFKNLYKAITQQLCDDDFLVRLMAQKKRKFIRIENGKPYITFKFDLSKAQFKGVEKKIVELEGCKNS